MEAAAIYIPEMPWGQQDGYPEELGVKVLREDAACGARTLLVRVPPGGAIPAHTHRGVVQRYILEGQCEIAGTDFPAGSFSLLPEHCDIARIGSRDGATLLLIYDPIAA